MSDRFGEAGGELDYGSYLAVGELLTLQRMETGEHDELLFVVIHQVYELWFKLVLHELEAVRDALDDDDPAAARHALNRIAVVERVLIQQVDVLDTMRPQDFLAFRSALAPASGFQSVQWRELEFLSGLKDPTYLGRVRTTAAERTRLERRLAEPTVWDAFVALLARRGDDLAAVAGTRGELFDVAEGLLDHDEAVSRWRHRHVLMTERHLGTKPGTGGSTGAEYLRSTLGKRFYPQLWELRSSL